MRFRGLWHIINQGFCNNGLRIHHENHECIAYVFPVEVYDLIEFHSGEKQEAPLLFPTYPSNGVFTRERKRRFN